MDEIQKQAQSPNRHHVRAELNLIDLANSTQKGSADSVSTGSFDKARGILEKTQIELPPGERPPDKLPPLPPRQDRLPNLIFDDAHAMRRESNFDRFLTGLHKDPLKFGGGAALGVLADGVLISDAMTGKTAVPGITIGATATVATFHDIYAMTTAASIPEMQQSAVRGLGDMLAATGAFIHFFPGGRVQGALMMQTGIAINMSSNFIQTHPVVGK